MQHHNLKLIKTRKIISEIVKFKITLQEKDLYRSFKIYLFIINLTNHKILKLIIKKMLLNFNLKRFFKLSLIIKKKNKTLHLINKSKVISVKNNNYNQIKYNKINYKIMKINFFKILW